MGYPNIDMKCMQIRIYVHHMEIDSMFDFINGRTGTPPEYWINKEDLPATISGGFLEVLVDWETYTNVRQVLEHSTWNKL